jgi:hypothetical protein
MNHSSFHICSVTVVLAGCLLWACSSSDTTPTSNGGSAGHTGWGLGGMGGEAGAAGSAGGEAGSAGAAGAQDGAAGATGDPNACYQTCVNGALNHEGKCDACLEKMCPTQYAACMADVGNGCIGCADTGSGIMCDGSDALSTALLKCACKATTCK